MFLYYRIYTNHDFDKASTLHVCVIGDKEWAYA